MWLCGSDFFLSIVDDGAIKDHLVVRARRPGDIERVFPGYKTKTLRGRDYMFRCHIPRDVVADVIRDHVLGISYPNFKGATDDDELHHAYAQFWNIHAKLQPKPPYRM